MRPPPDKKTARHGETPAGLEIGSRGAGTEAKPTPSDDPFASRRRFLVLALMAGWIKPERVTERIVAEVEAEATS